MSTLSSTLPTLPPRAAYILLNNPTRRNALSHSILTSLRTQLIQHNTSSRSGRLLLLPPFSASILPQLERGGRPALSPHDSPNAYEASFRGTAGAAEAQDYSWLVDGERWREERGSLPSCLVLRADASVPVFSSGHDLAELAALSAAQQTERIRETFALCAEVMALIRRSPAPVVCVVHGLATAAGAQLALTGDFVIAGAATQFMLPGAKLGLPCTSPASVVARRVGAAAAYRMMAMAGEGMRADEMGGAVDVVLEPAGTGQEADVQGVRAEALEQRAAKVVDVMAGQTAGMPQALSKWAFWTQVGLGGRDGGDGYEEAVEWTGRVMALHARSEDAREGMAAFLEKRQPSWKT